MSLSNISDEDLLRLHNLYSSGDIPTNTSRLSGLIKTAGTFDIKFAYHCVRLCLEAEQIAREHTLDLERNGETLKAIRRGEWSLDKLTKWMEAKLVSLETDYANSSLQVVPDEAKIKKVLLECLEMKYGTLQKTQEENKSDKLLTDLKKLVKLYS